MKEDVETDGSDTEEQDWLEWFRLLSPQEQADLLTYLETGHTSHLSHALRHALHEAHHFLPTKKMGLLSKDR